MRESARQIHNVPARSDRQQFLQLLEAIQLLCSRGASTEKIYELCDEAIRRISGRH